MTRGARAACGALGMIGAMAAAGLVPAAVAQPAAPEPRAVAPEPRAGAQGPAGAAPTIDWAAGRVVARGLGLADRQAPNPAVARGPARRTAEEAARAQLAAALPRLPLATGGTVADRLADPAVQARLDRAVARALVIDAEPETDGSWRVALAVPLEAVRLALTGPRVLAAGEADAGPPVVIVEGIRATPALGVTVGGVAGATLWVPTAPAWAKGAPRVKATGATAGAISLATPTGTASTLFVLVTR